MFHAGSRLHLVDAELKEYKGREKQLLREYRAEFSSALIGDGKRDAGRDSGGSGGGGGGYGPRPGTKPGRQKSVLELAQEEEARRVDASLQATLDRIMSRKNNRR